MTGGLEAHLIHTQLALRFGLMALAGVSIYWAVEDFAGWIKAKRHKDPTIKAPLFAAKGFMGIAILFYSPALLNRAMVVRMEEIVVEICTIVAMICTLLFFLSMHVSRLLYYGYEKKEALWRTLPVLLAAALLVMIGAFVNVQVG